ncbi:MAG: hypothetical protein U0835_08620 [Isosphaeraceae bacterium]
MGGRVADYTIHFDRNSLRESVRLGDGLIALTSSGTLLRFDLPDVRLVRERIGTEEVTCLGRGEKGAVLAGCSDGRVCRVDPKTLELTELVKLPAPPSWLGWSEAVGRHPAGLVVVTRPTKTVEQDGHRWDVPYSVVHDLAGGKTYTQEREATAVLLDRAGRLWLGEDHGEWGGRVTRVDLVRGTSIPLNPPPRRIPNVRDYWKGVCGFIEHRDGQVWAFGGTSHMGFNSGEITRVDTIAPKTLFAFAPLDELRNVPDPNRPRLPFTHVIEEKDGLLVVSFSDVFRVDRELKNWKKLAELHIQYRWGRPDAVGSYPAVRVVHPPARAREPYVFATVADGYLTLNGGKTTSCGVPGQLGASDVSELLNSTEGILAQESDDRLPVWTLGADGWRAPTFAPPYQPAPANENDGLDLEKDEDDWYETRVLVGPDGAIWTVSASSCSPGTRTSGRRVNGKTERVGREVSWIDPSSSFITADSTLWNVSSDGLNRFQGGLWQVVGKLPDEKRPRRPRAVGTKGPPRVLRDALDGQLWRLDHGRRGENPRLSPVKSVEAGKPLRVHDAIDWTDGTILLATDAGLRTIPLAGGPLSRVDLPEPPSPATSLVRDGQGRLWLGGEKGLWMFEPGAKVVEDLARVPWVGRGGVRDLVADPAHADGVIAALGERGVASVRLRRTE